MRTAHRRTALTALVMASALVLVGCSGSDDPDDDVTGDTGDDAAPTGSVILANGTEPQNPLIPADTNEVGGGKILDLMFAGLVHYEADGTTVNEIAESFESNEDYTEWTITINDGWEFTNGEPVTAASFVNAWKDGAYRLNSYFFSYIEGFDDEAMTELSGVEVVDDTTFTVKLVEATADFPLHLGYSAYYPLPEVFFDDPEAFGQNPIGNGPYMFDGEDAWQHNVEVSLVPNPGYNGVRPAENAGVTLVFYQSQDAAYNDLLAGQLDVLDAIPDSAFGTYEDDLEGRSVSQGAAVFQSFTIPMALEHFSGEEGQLRRAALSHAINREEITEEIFQGTRTPAHDFTSPVVAGYSEDIPGSDVLEFDPDRARELWAEAEAIAPFTGTFTLAYNADGGHQAWVDAVTNSIRNVLEISAEGAPYPTFAEMRTDVTERTITGAFRTGWQADYPSMSNFLGPLYATGAGSNDGDYSNPEFDRLVAEAGSIIADDEEAGIAMLQEAQELLFQDLPAIPLWYSTATGGWSENVENVEFGWNGVPVFEKITKA